MKGDRDVSLQLYIIMPEFSSCSFNCYWFYEDTCCRLLPKNIYSIPSATFFKKIVGKYLQRSGRFLRFEYKFITGFVNFSALHKMVRLMKLSHDIKLFRHMYDDFEFLCRFFLVLLLDWRVVNVLGFFLLFSPEIEEKNIFEWCSMVQNVLKIGRKMVFISKIYLKISINHDS